MDLLQLPKGTLTRHVGGFVGRLPVKFEDADVREAGQLLADSGVDISKATSQAEVVAAASNSLGFRASGDTTKVVTAGMSRGTGKYSANT
ncbi:MAG: hypothetical protein GC134_06870 [Proteobacteria bacterium]|nr:hypothetical protein [Pseudomonadota bacterium]